MHAMKTEGIILSILCSLFSACCSSCVYQYNVQPKSFYSCNPSLCNCSLELECSVTMPTEVAGNIAVQWYYLDTVTGQVQTINRHDIVEKWIENNVISTKLQLIDLNDRESFTSYWCSIVDPQYHVAMSNVMQLHISDHMLQSCRSTMDGYSHVNTTCASYYRVNKQIKSNIKPTIISCLCVLLVVLVFLWIVVLYKKTKTRNAMIGSCQIESPIQYDIYSEPSEITHDLIGSADALYATGRGAVVNI